MHPTLSHVDAKLAQSFLRLGDVVLPVVREAVAASPRYQSPYPPGTTVRTQGMVLDGVPGVMKTVKFPDGTIDREFIPQKAARAATAHAAHDDQ